MSVGQIFFLAKDKEDFSNVKVSFQLTKKYKNDKFVAAKIRKETNRIETNRIVRPALANFASAFSNSFSVAMALTKTNKHSSHFLFLFLSFKKLTLGKLSSRKYAIAFWISNPLANSKYVEFRTCSIHHS